MNVALPSLRAPFIGVCPARVPGPGRRTVRSDHSPPVMRAGTPSRATEVNLAADGVAVAHGCSGLACWAGDERRAVADADGGVIFSPSPVQEAVIVPVVWPPSTLAL